MGQTLTIPEIADSGRHGLDFFLNSQQVQQLIRQGIDIDHVLNPYSFPRTNDKSVSEQKEIIPNPEIINIPTHITPKSIKIVQKTVKDSTNTDIIVWALQFNVSVTVPSMLTLYFCTTQPQFATNPIYFQPNHPLLLQPINVPLHPCIDELIEIALPQCFIEFLAFTHLSSSLESQGSNLYSILNISSESLTSLSTLSTPIPSPTATPAQHASTTNHTDYTTFQASNPTLFSQAFEIQGIPAPHYLSLYLLSKSIASLFTHIVLSIQTLIPVQSSSNSSFSSSPSPPPQSILTEWAAISLKTSKNILNPSQLRDVVTNFQITGHSYDATSLNLPVRESILYSLLSNVAINTYTHHIYTNDECLELLDLYGFINNDSVLDNRKDLLTHARTQSRQSQNSSSLDNTLPTPIDDPMNIVTPAATEQFNDTGNEPSGVANLDQHLQTINILNNAQFSPQFPSNFSQPRPDVIGSDDDIAYPWHKYPNMTEVPNDCIICMTSVATHVIYPCRHLCLCAFCANDVIIKAQQQSEQGSDGIGITIGRSGGNHAKCPLCRQQLTCIFNLSNSASAPAPAPASDQGQNDIGDDDFDVPPV